MLRITATIGALLFFGGSWLSGEVMPHLTHTAADYVLMPLCGYLGLLGAAHGAARLLPAGEKS